MAQWPVPYKSRYIDTRYGKVHVIIRSRVVQMNTGKSAKIGR